MRSEAQRRRRRHRIARTLGGFAHGLYLSDFYLSSDHRGWMTLAFGAVQLAAPQ